jgi:hypothetical protein
MFKLKILGATAILAAAAAVMPGSAHALPAAQGRCVPTPPNGGTVATNTAVTGFLPIPDLSLRINNGLTPRRAVVRVSADIGVDPVAEVRIGYKIDAGPIQEGVFGPANLANHQEFFETRATMAIVPLAAGVHTVVPFWRISGAAGKNATMTARCATIEGFTK